jgi:hypothetical protein
LATRVNQAINEFPVVQLSSPTPRRSHPGVRPSLAACVSAKIEEGDIRGAVRLASSDDSLAPQNEITAAALTLLHASAANFFGQRSICISEPCQFNATIVIVF